MLDTLRRDWKNGRVEDNDPDLYGDESDFDSDMSSNKARAF